MSKRILSHDHSTFSTDPKWPDLHPNKTSVSERYRIACEMYNEWWPEEATQNRLKFSISQPLMNGRLVFLKLPSGLLYFTWARLDPEAFTRLLRLGHPDAGTWPKDILSGNDPDLPLWVIDLVTRGYVPPRKYVPAVCRWFIDNQVAQPGEYLMWKRRGRKKFGRILLRSDVDADDLFNSVEELKWDPSATPESPLGVVSRIEIGDVEKEARQLLIAIQASALFDGDTPEAEEDKRKYSKELFKFKYSGKVTEQDLLNNVIVPRYLDHLVFLNLPTAVGYFTWNRLTEEEQRRLSGGDSPGASTWKESRPGDDSRLTVVDIVLCGEIDFKDVSKAILRWFLSSGTGSEGELVHFHGRGLDSSGSVRVKMSHQMKTEAMSEDLSYRMFQEGTLGSTPEKET